MADSAIDTGSGPRRPSIQVIALVAVLVAVIGLAVSIGDWMESGPAVASPTTTVPPTTTTIPKPRPQVPVSTLLASPKGSISTFDAPDGTEVGEVGYFYGYEQTMPVLEQRPGWLRIRLPERPNGSTAWVHEADVVTSSTPYRIVIDRSETHVTVFQDGFPIFTMPAGIGKASTPTPLGSFYVAVIETGGHSGGYGPIILDTSGHSEAIQSWQGAGDAIIALHGPISASSDARIGTTGTTISNGCIRLHDADQLKLGIIPLGTPVDIVE